MKKNMGSTLITILTFMVMIGTIVLPTFLQEQPWIMLAMLYWVVERDLTEETKERVSYQVLSVTSAIFIVYLMVCSGWFPGVISDSVEFSIVLFVMCSFFYLLSKKTNSKQVKKEWETSND